MGPSSCWLPHAGLLRPRRPAWWGNRVVQLGVGAHVPFRKLDRERLHQGLGTVLRPDVRERARELGQAIQAEGDGLPEAAEFSTTGS